MKTMKNLEIRMQVDQDDDSRACFEVYDAVGDDGWGEGVGPKKLAAFLRNNPQIKEIEVRINSNGGDAFAGMAIVNLLRSAGKPIHVCVDGIAASAASSIAMAGDTITMPETSMLMIHNAYTFVCGNAKALRKTADDLDKVMQSIKLLYLNKSGGKLTDKKLDELLDAETYLSAEEAFKLGLCDEVIDANGDPKKFEEEPDDEDDDEEGEEESKEENKEEKPEDESDDDEKKDDKVKSKAEWFFW